MRECFHRPNQYNIQYSMISLLIIRISDYQCSMLSQINHFSFSGTISSLIIRNPSSRYVFCESKLRCFDPSRKKIRDASKLLTKPIDKKIDQCCIIISLRRHQSSYFFLLLIMFYILYISLVASYSETKLIFH